MIKSLRDGPSVRKGAANHGGPVKEHKSSAGARYPWSVPWTIQPKVKGSSKGGVIT